MGNEFYIQLDFTKQDSITSQTQIKNKNAKVCSIKVKGTVDFIDIMELVVFF